VFVAESITTVAKERMLYLSLNAYYKLAFVGESVTTVEKERMLYFVICV